MVLLALHRVREENPDFQITGDLSLKLVNSFKIGEELNIYWDKYSTNSQNLKLGFQFPYLFFFAARF